MQPSAIPDPTAPVLEDRALQLDHGGEPEFPTRLFKRLKENPSLATPAVVDFLADAVEQAVRWGVQDRGLDKPGNTRRVLLVQCNPSHDPHKDNILEGIGAAQRGVMQAAAFCASNGIECEIRWLSRKDALLVREQKTTQRSTRSGGSMLSDDVMQEQRSSLVVRNHDFLRDGSIYSLLIVDDDTSRGHSEAAGACRSEGLDIEWSPPWLASRAKWHAGDTLS